MKYSIKELPVAKDNPQRTSRMVEWGGMYVSMYEAHQSMDKHKPGEQCQIRHWGYVLEGQFRCKFADHEEVYTAGDVFYIPPGHTTVYDTGVVMIGFTPADEVAKEQADKANS